MNNSDIQKIIALHYKDGELNSVQLKFLIDTSNRIITNSKIDVANALLVAKDKIVFNANTHYAPTSYSFKYDLNRFISEDNLPVNEYIGFEAVFKAVDTEFRKRQANTLDDLLNALHKL